MRCSQRIALRLHNGAQRFGDVARFDQREPLRRADLILALLRDDACFKAQTVHLAEPLGKMVHAAQLCITLEPPTTLTDQSYRIFSGILKSNTS